MVRVKQFTATKIFPVFFAYQSIYIVYVCIYIHFLNLWKVTVQHFNISIIFSIHEMFKSQSNLVYIFIWTVKKKCDDWLPLFVFNSFSSNSVILVKTILMLQIVISDMTMLFEFLFIFKLLNVKLNYEY